MYPFKPQIMIIRFLGITPTSSAVHTTLISICQQLCYNLEVPIEEIPTDFVPLKNYFKSLLDLASKTMFTVILLGKLIFHTFIFSTYGIYITYQVDEIISSQISRLSENLIIKSSNHFWWTQWKVSINDKWHYINFL